MITPVDEILEPDAQKLTSHRWLIDYGVELAVFDTATEANSMSTEEKVGFTMEDL